MTIDDARHVSGVTEEGGSAEPVLFRIVDIDLGQIKLADSLLVKTATKIGERLDDLDSDANSEEFVKHVRELVNLVASSFFFLRLYLY